MHSPPGAVHATLDDIVQTQRQTSPQSPKSRKIHVKYTQTEPNELECSEFVTLMAKRQVHRIRNFSFRNMTAKQIAIVMLTFGFTLIVSAVFVGLQGSIFPDDDLKYVTMEDVNSGLFSSAGLSYTFGVDENEVDCMVSTTGVRMVKYSLPSLTYAGVIYDLGQFSNPQNIPLSFNYFRVEMNRRIYVSAISYRIVPYQSGRAIYTVYDLKENVVKYATGSDKDHLNCLKFSTYYQHEANVFPRFKKRDGVYYLMAIVRDYNLFIRDYISGSQYQVTFHDKETSFRAATSFGASIDSCSTFWSPDQRFLAFLSLNATNMPTYDLVTYNMNEAYLKAQETFYVFPGFPRFVTVLSIHNLVTRTTSIINTQDIPRDSYYLDLGWVNETHFQFTTMPRMQTQTTVWVCNAIDSRLSFVRQTFSSKAWLERFPSFQLSLGNQYATLAPHPDFNTHYHVAIFDATTDRIAEWLTTGLYDVSTIHTYKHPYLWVSSNEGDVFGNDVYRVDVTTKTKERITPGEGNHNAEFSVNGDWFIIRSAGPDIPKMYMSPTANPRTIYTLAENKHIPSNIKKYHMSEKLYIFVPTPDGGLYGSELRPPKFSASVQYPAVIYIYNGPDSRSVKYQWSVDYHSTLAAQGIVVYSFDSRGTSGRGEAFKKSVYGDLGKLETDDLYHFIEYISSQTYINKDRIGVWGWSYGGYATLMGVSDARGSKIKAAVAVAPVVDWRYYQTTYTERYMGDVNRNAGGYQVSSILNRVANIRAKLLIVHGTGDDNVHYRHTALLLKGLVDNNVDFEALPYTNENHALGGAVDHMYRKMTEFWLRNLRTD